MAFLKNPIAKVVGNSNPNKIDLICEVKVQFTDLDRRILQNAPNTEAFQVHFSVRNYDGIPDPPGGRAPLARSVGDVNVSLSMGNPDAHIFLTKTFDRGGDLNEDPFPFPNNEDEIYIEVSLLNFFSNNIMGYVNSPVIKGSF